MITIAPQAAAAAWPWLTLYNRFPQQPTARLPRPFEPDVEALRHEFVGHFATQTGTTLTPGDWTPDEHRTADELHPKYAVSEWTTRS